MDVEDDAVRSSEVMSGASTPANHIPPAPILSLLHPSVKTPPAISASSTPIGLQAADLLGVAPGDPPRAARTSSSRSSGSGSARRKDSASKIQSYHRITRLVSTMVHAMIHRHPISTQHTAPTSSHPAPMVLEHSLPNSSPSSAVTPPSAAADWTALVADRSCRPSAGLYAFTYRVITNAKLSLPVILVGLKYLDLLQRRHFQTASNFAVSTPPSESDMVVDEDTSVDRTVGCFTDRILDRDTLPPALVESGMLLSCLMTANKFLDDSRYSNLWWSQVSEMSLDDVNSFEVNFLVGLGYNLHMEESVYLEWADSMQRLSKWLESSEEKSIGGGGTATVLATSDTRGTAHTQAHPSSFSHASPFGNSPNISIAPCDSSKTDPVSLRVPGFVVTSTSSPSMMSLSSSTPFCSTPSTPFSSHNQPISHPQLPDAKHPFGGKGLSPTAMSSSSSSPISPMHSSFTTIPQHKLMLSTPQQPYTPTSTSIPLPELSHSSSDSPGQSRFEDFMAKQDLLLQLLESNSPTLKSATFSLLSKLDASSANGLPNFATRTGGILESSKSLPRWFKEDDPKGVTIPLAAPHPLRSSLPRSWREGDGGEEGDRIQRGGSSGGDGGRGGVGLLDPTTAALVRAAGSVR